MGVERQFSDFHDFSFSFAAISMWSLVHSTRVCQNGYVPMDVYWRPLSAQRCDSDSFSRAISARNLCRHRLGSARADDGMRNQFIWRTDKVHWRCSLQATWAGFTAGSMSNRNCWFGYNLTPYYWILEGPRLIVILVSKNDIHLPWLDHHVKFWTFCCLSFSLTLYSYLIL